MHLLGVAGMPRRIPDYPDAFYTFNKIASWGSEISAFSLVIFLGVFIEAFYLKINRLKLLIRIITFIFTEFLLFLLYGLFIYQKNTPKFF